MYRPRRICTLLTVLVLWMTSPAHAQPPEVLKKMEEAKAKAAAAAAGAQPGQPAGEVKPGETKPDGDKPKEGEEKKEDATPKVIKRPDAPEGTAADMAALRQQIDRDGMVHFNLEGTPWPDLLRWLADASSLSLDWQELPGDTLNLRTQHPYTIEEARDVINRHLLSRGYTMLKHGELLSVVKIDKLNPGLLPRVSPEELDERMPHEFVKVSFPLDWLIASKAVEELKPMLSPNGKLTALTSTNRLEAMDAVVNLREIRTVLSEEQTDTTDNRVVEIFQLQHVPAQEAVGLIEQILGLETARAMSGGIDNNASQMIMQQLQQLQQNMQRQQQQPGGGGGASGEEQKPKLIVNERDNSIVAHAPPDKMEIIRQTVTALDTPSSRRGSAPHTKIFRLSTLDPVPLVGILKELADFSPSTKIQADSTNNSLIVHGTLVDLNSVYELVKELDGSTRNFEVIPLRRLAADEVAGTIEYLMGGAKEDNKSQDSGYYSYYSYRGGRGDSNSQSKDDKRPFKVDADLENNRLLLWANEVELEEVQNLLVKMGEIPGGGSDETLRVIEFSSDADADAVIERLRQMWPQLGPNELQIQPSPQSREQPSADEQEQKEEPAASAPSPADEAPFLTDDIRTAATDVVPTHPLLLARADFEERSTPATVGRLSESSHAGEQPIELAQTTGHDSESRTTDGRATVGRPSESPGRLNASDAARSSIGSGAAPPIVIQRGPDGRLIITCSDPKALDRLEEMMSDVAPPRKDYHIFQIKYPQTWVYGIELTLKDFFEGDMDSTTSFDPYWGTPITKKASGGTRLSKRKPLKIISDLDSRTILVQGATPSQLATIRDLIEVYDRPTTGDPQAMRVTKFFNLKHSSAQTMADTIKSVYRDLLSTNDPALKDPNGNKENRPQDQGTTISYTYNRGGSEGEDEREEPSRIQYDGLLSVGVDEVSNTLVVSAIEGLMLEITELVETLDEAAKPAGNFRVVPVDPSINSALIQARLQKLLGSKRSQQQQPANANPQPNSQPAPNGNNNGTPGAQAGFSNN